MAVKRESKRNRIGNGAIIIVTHRESPTIVVDGGSMGGATGRKILTSATREESAIVLDASVVETSLAHFRR